MNAVILLSGGNGSRMLGSIDCPKQYYEINGKPIISYSLKTFQCSRMVDKILIVAEGKWQKYISSWIGMEDIDKFCGFARPGETRQLSVYHGLKALKDLLKEQDIVLIHDAARPLVSDRIIEKCLDIPEGYDGVMPVLPVTDTVYQSRNGQEISQLLPRKEVYAGQAPESFQYGKYMKIHEMLPRETVEQSSGSSAIACQNGMKIALIPGERKNIKITEPEDIQIFQSYLCSENTVKKAGRAQL